MVGTILLVLALSLSFTSAAKILILPADFGFNSRLMNLGKMGAILYQDGGHDVTMLLNSIILEKHTWRPPHGVQTKVYHVEASENIRLVTDPSVLDEVKAISDAKSITAGAKLWAKIEIPFCESFLSSDQAILQNLKQAGFDLVIVDVLSDCYRLVVDYLDVPSIVVNNFGFMPVYDILYPNLPSFVCDPMINVCENDQMDFSQRFFNFVAKMVGMSVVHPHLLSYFDDLRIKYNINTSLRSYDSFRRSLMLVRVHYVFDYPRPLMPNVIPISGLFIEPTKPLPTDLKSIIESPEYEQLVVVSFGSLIPRITKEKADIMARVLSRLPAIVIWRYKDERLESMGRNIHLVDWFPQADVLAHEKTRLFVTHCGISSTYETGFHGVPVIAVPIFMDQSYNAEKVVGRAKMGRTVDIRSFTEEEFSDAVWDVFSNLSYKINAEKVRDELRHQVVEPKKNLLYWVDHLIKFGTKSLISEPAIALTNLQLYSVDVIALIAIIIVVSLLCLLCACASVRRACQKWFKSQKDIIQKKGL